MARKYVYIVDRWYHGTKVYKYAYLENICVGGFFSLCHFDKTLLRCVMWSSIWDFHMKNCVKCQTIKKRTTINSNIFFSYQKEFICANKKRDPFENETCVIHKRNTFVAIKTEEWSKLSRKMKDGIRNGIWSVEMCSYLHRSEFKYMILGECLEFYKFCFHFVENYLVTHMQCAEHVTQMLYMWSNVYTLKWIGLVFEWKQSTHIFHGLISEVDFNLGK